MITSHEKHEPTETELINAGLAEFSHHPVFQEITQHDQRLKDIQEIKEAFWNMAIQIHEGSDSEERLGKLTKATLIDIERILDL